MMTLQQRANEMLNNWTPETASLISTLKRHGFEIVSGHNGEEAFKLEAGREGMKKFIENLIACDEAHLYVRQSGGKLHWLFLVLGNSPGEIVCDYACDDALDKATEEHYNRWEGRKQPKIKASDRYPDIYGPAALAAKAKERLEYLRGELRAERISYGEIVELQSLVSYIAADDVELLQAAGVEEGGAQ